MDSFCIKISLIAVTGIGVFMFFLYCIISEILMRRNERQFREMKEKDDAKLVAEADARSIRHGDGSTAETDARSIRRDGQAT